MKAITLRNLPADLDKAIRKRAREQCVSVNKTVIGLLKEHLTQAKKKDVLYHDLDHLCGAWTDDIAGAIDEALIKQRSIDAAIWK